MIVISIYLLSWNKTMRICGVRMVISNQKMGKSIPWNALVKVTEKFTRTDKKYFPTSRETPKDIFLYDILHFLESSRERKDIFEEKRTFALKSKIKYEITNLQLIERDEKSERSNSMCNANPIKKLKMIKIGWLSSDVSKKIKKFIEFNVWHFLNDENISTEFAETF